MKYHIWTEGCQMNVADSQRMAGALEQLGYHAEPEIEKADVIVLNTCVVRQSAEDKALGRLTSLRPLKERRPDLVINLMGCFVGVRGAEKLRERLPFVDVFSPPSDPGPLVSFLTQDEIRVIETDETTRRFAMMDDELILPQHERGRLVSAHVPVVYGCSHACTFCIIPFRRGIERSRPVGDIVHEIEGIERIRFLTSHPNYFTEELMDAVAELPKVMPHIEVPIQAGDDEVLANMKRGYTQKDYRILINKIRKKIPDCSIATDVIVGFPDETEAQFMETYRVLSDLRLDVAHLARYSPREGTVATRRMVDNVSDEEKMRRFRLLEELQEKIVGEINQKYLGQSVDVLFEEKVKGRWRGRTPTNKLVFVESGEDPSTGSPFVPRAATARRCETAGQSLRGRIEPVKVTWTGPWSMQANLQRQPILINA